MGQQAIAFPPTLHELFFHSWLQQPVPSQTANEVVEFTEIVFIGEVVHFGLQNAKNSFSRWAKVRYSLRRTSSV